MSIFSERTVLTVTRLTSLLRDVIEENFEHVWVEGEISNISFPSSGHIYFTLKDSGAQLRCVLFKNAAKNLKFQMKDGMALITSGRLSLYDQRGEYQLIVEYVEPAGIGALQLAFVQLKERLFKEGLFDEAHKRPLPTFPRTLGVITSPTGAAIHDILNVLKRRFASLEVLIYPVRVQGEGSALEIARAIDEMNRLNQVDVLIVGRGGGSLEDLWAFNNELVARAVHRSKIPIISAVGHETDWSICDFVSDLRAPTPSAAAELVIQSATEIRANVEQLWHRLVLGMEFRLKQLRGEQNALKRAITDPSTMLGHLIQRVDDFSERHEMAGNRELERRYETFNRLQTALLQKSPEKEIEKHRQAIIGYNSTMEHLITKQLEDAQNSFEVCASQLDVLSPIRTLGRGYAVVADKNGTVIKDAATLHLGDSLILTLHKGTANCLVI